MDLNLIMTFVVAFEEGGVTAAARRLKVPKSTISRRLARLEDDLGVPLLLRTGPGFALTAEGRRLFEDTRASIHALEPLQRDNRRKLSASGSFVMQVPRILAEGLVNAILVDYLAATPNQTVQVVHGDRFTDSRAQNVDLFILVGANVPQSSGERALLPVEARLYASPRLFDGGPGPLAPRDVESWPYLALCTVAGVPERLTLESSHGRVTTVAPRTRLASNELSTLITAAERGLGIVQLPNFIGDPLVQAGKLAPVLPDERTDRFQVSLVLPPGNRNQAAQSFANFLERCIRSPAGMA